MLQITFVISFDKIIFVTTSKCLHSCQKQNSRTKLGGKALERLKNNRNLVALLGQCNQQHSELCQGRSEPGVSLFPLSPPEQHTQLLIQQGPQGLVCLARLSSPATSEMQGTARAELEISYWKHWDG